MLLPPSHLFRRFKPYFDPVLQRLSTRCCLLLVAVSSVLLRSQTLLSSARTINFAPAEPDQTATTMPLDVQVCVFIILSCLVLPLVWLVNPFDWIFTCFSLIRKQLWRLPSKESNHLDQQASFLKPRTEAKDMDAEEGTETINVVFQCEAAARYYLTYEAACDEGIDLEMDLFSGSCIDQNLPDVCGGNRSVRVRGPVRNTAVATHSRAYITNRIHQFNSKAVARILMR